jgi:hypothetical protein
LHVFRVKTGLTTNVQLAISGDLAAGKDWLAVAVDEASQGEDRNGDGDVDDLVLHVLRVRTGLTTNVQLAVSGDLAAGKDWLAFAVDETSQGEDRNNDKDTVDLVLHVLRVRTGLTTNVQLDASGGFFAGEDWLAFAVHERLQGEGGTDLNEDGDTVDFILHVFNVKKGTTTNVRRNVRRVRLGEDWLAFTVAEASQEGADGLGTDLNRDGDAVDEVLHVFNVKKGTTTNVRWSVAPAVFGSFTADGDHIAFTVSEASQGGTDLNGDNDATDYVLHVVNPENDDGCRAPGRGCAMQHGGKVVRLIHAMLAHAAGLPPTERHGWRARW